MKVKLLAHTQLSADFAREILDENNYMAPDSQMIALSAIRTCYSANKPTEIVKLEGEKYFGRQATDGEGGTEADRLIRHIMRSKHLSTVEHLTYTFAVEGLSRAALAQLTRHRHMSFSVQSQRYTRYFKEEIEALKAKKEKYKNPNKRHGHCQFTIGEELLIQDLYLSGLSAQEIADQMNSKKTTILGILRAYNTPMRKNNESVVDHNFFSKIDTPRKAQMLGFIAADGSVGAYPAKKKNRDYICYQLGAEVKGEDGYYLQQILDDLKSRNSVATSARGTCSICIVSEQIYKNLVSLGITQNKTATLDLTNIIEKVPEELLNSFVLGYFEGNGYINKKDSSRSFIISTGSKKAAQQLAFIIEKGTGVKPRVRDEENVHKVAIYAEAEIEKVLLWMYKDIDLRMVLRRKLIKACESYHLLDEWRKEQIARIAEGNHFFLPEKMLSNPKATFVVLEYLDKVRSAYVELVASGIPQEDARMLTGQGFETNLVLTANLRAILEFYAKRKPGRGAQHEIAQLAEAIRREVTKVDPWLERFFEEV